MNLLKRGAKKILVLSVLLLLTGGAAFAGPIVIKLGSPTPEGSPWHDALQELAADWKRISEGKVQVRIFPNGIAGDERDMIRKMRINTIQAAVISGAGLNDIAADSIVLSLPFLFHSDDELSYVFSELKPKLERDMENAGFKMIAWTKAGWLYFFSREPVVYPSDLKKQKLAATDVDVSMAPALKNIGFSTVTLTLNEIMAGLASGMVDACYTVPLGAIAYQWFGIANNMCKLPMAPVLGGIIISERIWRGVPDSIKPQLIASAERVGRQLEKQNGDMEREMMRIMREHGLREHSVPPAAEQEWRKLFSRAIESLAGENFSKDVYSRVVRLLDEHRN
jgi:TRAP-type transport system periplasmic protein